MSLNKIMLIGHVGKEPDVRTLDGGVKVATFSLATTEKGYTLQNGTHVPDRTEWHNVVVLRGLADVVEKYIHKGDKLYVEGKIRTRSYDDKSGVKRFITEVFTDSMEILSGKTRKPEHQDNQPDDSVQYDDLPFELNHENEPNQEKW